MTDIALPETGDALDALVDQFSDPLACLRELVQNAVDAGTLQVDVAFEYDAGEGLLTIRVDDYGEGMDRHIIETRLTRLFSSGKDNDLTKIGRFGIGFVSVFALQPDVVCVDTGRGGESWRIVFREDRTFTRVALDAPVDGTKVRIIRHANVDEFEALRERARAVLDYWCKHVDADIYFDGEPLSRPLDLDARCVVRFEEEGTTILAGVDPQGGHSRGFYNRGLTLLEASDPGDPSAHFPGIAYKVSSRYLEHTLTRDNVVHDAHYMRAMDLVRELIEGPLAAKLAATLAEGPLDDVLIAGAGAVLRQSQSPAVVGTVLFETVSGEGADIGKLRAARDRVLCCESADDALAQALAARGDLVLVVDDDRRALAATLLDARVPSVHDRAVLPEPVRDERLIEPWRALHGAIIGQLGAYGAKVADVRLARFRGAIADRVVITQRSFGKPTPLAEIEQLDTKMFARKRTVVVNAGHPQVARLLDLAAREPALAAYTLLKLFFLGQPQDPALDSRLLAHAMEHRWRQSTH